MATPWIATINPPRKGARLGFRRAMLGDVPYLGVRLRQADLEEITASCPGMTPGEVLAWSLGCSSNHSWTVCRLTDGAPIFMTGVANTGGRTGAPWLLGTDDCERHVREILALTRMALVEFDKDFDLLMNTIDTNNRMHVRWVKALGFTVDDAPGLRFQTFERTRPNV